MIRPSPCGELTLSERLYRWLLRAYPRAFREEYATEMFLVFRDTYFERSRYGRWGVLGLWRDIFTDFITTVCVQHVRSWLPRDQRDLALAGKELGAMTLPFTLDVGQQTDIGRVRENNEDNLLAIVPADQMLLQSKGALFVVSDGFRGEVASKLAVETIKDAYYQDRLHDIPTALEVALKQANAAIFQAGEAERTQGDGSEALGATCVAAVLHEQMLYAANVGDSRVYVLHDGQLRQITHDHSVVAQMVERGEITAAAARTHALRNQIYRSLGCADVTVDLFTEPDQEGDTVILCTDGLCGVLDDASMRDIVMQYGPTASVQQLITRANEAGGPDNVTAIVVRVATA